MWAIKKKWTVTKDEEVRHSKKFREINRTRSILKSRLSETLPGIQNLSFLAFLCTLAVSSDVNSG
ncbi:Uncharacterized protein APZ42_029580 [Daphnia magna]|uniref:Uncharacterized protein n=1 Tax=Daphnia magna TaxID=35525 RepID=A0A164PPW0_9CRUS|nr:Uncharacterized protein APZ42_029580 [Daphnia magna]